MFNRFDSFSKFFFEIGYGFVYGFGCEFHDFVYLSIGVAANVLVSVLLISSVLGMACFTEAATGYVL